MANTSGYGYLLGPAPQFFDANGKPLVGGKLFVYIAGTTTTAVTYSDFNRTENTSPVILNDLGTCMLIVPSANLYKIVLYDRNGNLLLTRDNVSVSSEQQIIYTTANRVDSSDSTVDVTATTDPDTGIVTYDLSIQKEIDRAEEAEGALAEDIADETDRATAAEKASKTEVVAGDNITVTKTVGADGQDVYTIDGEGEDNLVDDVRVNGTSVVTDKVANIDIPDDTELKFTDMVVFGYPSFSESVTTAVSTYSDFYYDTRKIAGHRIQVVYQNNNTDQGMQYPEIRAYDENGTQIFFKNWAATYGTTTMNASIPSGAVKLHIRVPRYCRASFTWTCIDPINDRVASIRSSDNSVNVSTRDGVADITLPGDVVRDSNYTHIDAGTANPLMDGTASAGTSVKYAREDHVHQSDTSREAVANKTTVVLGTSESKYPTDKAVADFVNSSVATNTANYISNDGEPFTSVEELEAYPGTVTNNDYAFVTGTDSAGNTYYDRYKATVRGSTVTWALEYRLNNSSFTVAQWKAINSGITAALVGKIHEHSNKAVLDGITATDVSNWNGKKDKQTAVTFTGSTLKTPTSMTQDANGELAVTFTDIQSASTSQKGVVQLSDSTASASSETAATSAAVKQAYDLAASKQETITWMTDAEALQLWTDAWDAAT